MQAQPPPADTPVAPTRPVPASGYRAWLAWAAVGGLAVASSVEHAAAPAPTSVPPAPHTAAC